MNDIKSTAEYLIKAIVSDADAVSLETIEDNGILILKVIDPPEIIGQIIGQ